MFYDDERGGNREGSDESAPKKRKRISTGERYEKVRIGGGQRPTTSDPETNNDQVRERRSSTSNPETNNDRVRERRSNTSNPETNNDQVRERRSDTDRNPNYNSDQGRDRNFNSDRNSNYNSDRKPRYNSDNNRSSNYNSDPNRRSNYSGDRNRDTDYNKERNGNYNSDRPSRYGQRDNNSERPSRYGQGQGNDNRERPSRYGQEDGNRDGFRKKPSFGSSKSYGNDQRGGFKKTYTKSNGQSGFTKRTDKPYDRSGQRPHNDRFSNAPQRQPEYHFDEEPDDKPVRLNKYIANTGLCSRREADEHIQAGLITVNGQLVTEMGVKVSITDEVCYNGARLSAEKKVYILLNKPKDYVTSVDDPHAKRTIMELVQGACKERIYPVGRLDRMTTGVILLTNDGELTKKLTHPTSEIKKIYQVYLDKNVKPEDIDTIAEGLTLEDGFIKPDNIGFMREEDQNLIGIEIHSGRNRVVRRIFEHLGYKVTRLDRIFFAGLTKKGLSRGVWRYLSPREVGFLKMLKVD